MIIRYPTGLYRSQIPQDPSDSGNVTFTISNEEPATSGENFILFPVAETLRKRPDKVYSNEQRRATLGELVYSITSGGVPASGRSTKLFEVGQILEFTDETPEIVSVDAVPGRLEIQHNTNLLDLEALGLTEEEAAALMVDSAAAEEQIESQLTETQDQIAENKAVIIELQKTINEANKALDALAVLGGNEDVIEKITETKDEAQAEQTELSADTENLITLSAALQNKLFAISQLVR
jgi:hypothetical protein